MSEKPDFDAVVRGWAEQQMVVDRMMKSPRTDVATWLRAVRDLHHKTGEMIEQLRPGANTRKKRVVLQFFEDVKAMYAQWISEDEARINAMMRNPDEPGHA